jgi:shikimate kinase
MLAQRLGVTFIDLDERFAATYGDISKYLNAQGYTAYARQNVENYLDVIEAEAGSRVLALSSGFMTYATDVHPDYERLRREIATSATTLVLLPSLDYDTCVAEIVRRQLGRPFSRSAEREEQVIRGRFSVYRDLPATKLETMKPVLDVVEAAVANLLPNTALEPTPLAGSRRPAGARAAMVS